jgi:putative effector of murein hydrolase LrgA (UPF0299 family)
VRCHRVPLGTASLWSVHVCDVSCSGCLQLSRLIETLTAKACVSSDSSTAAVDAHHMERNDILYILLSSVVAVCCTLLYTAALQHLLRCQGSSRWCQTRLLAWCCILRRLTQHIIVLLLTNAVASCCTLLRCTALQRLLRRLGSRRWCPTRLLAWRC